MMRAAAVCTRLLRLSREKTTHATVHSVFDHAVNLALEDRTGLIGMIAREKTLTPYAVSVRTDRPFSEAGVRAGMAAVAENGRVCIPEAGVGLDLDAAAPVDLGTSSIEITRTAGRNDAALNTILRALEGADTDTSLAPLATGRGGNVYTRFLAPRMEPLFAAVAAEDAAAAADAASRVAGCGAGLTPSSDDLLTGYLSVLFLLAREQGREALPAVLTGAARSAAQKTNRISASFLLQCGEELVNQSIYELLHAIFQGADETAMEAAAGRVLAVGSTSGADMLTGIVLALRYHDGGNEQW